MADSENAEIEAARNRTADYSVRYSLKNLLTAMTLVAVMFAVLSPWLRLLSTAAQLNLAALWGVALLIGIPTGIGHFRAYRKFLADHADALILVANVKLGSWKRQMLLLALLLFVAWGSSFTSINLAGRASQALLFGFLPVNAIYGFQLGQFAANTVMKLAGYQQPLALREEGIVGLSLGTIPWAYIRGIRETKHPGIFLLRRYDGDLRLKVPAADVERFLALVGEKTGHTLAGSC